MIDDDVTNMRTSIHIIIYYTKSIGIRKLKESALERRLFLTRVCGLIMDIAERVIGFLGCSIHCFIILGIR
jgi:hypothetical protein